MLHDKATISQFLARGFDLCGRREGGAAGCGAGERWSPATGPSSALSGLDSRPCGFLPGFQTLLGILFLEAERSLRRATGTRFQVLGAALVGAGGPLLLIDYRRAHSTRGVRAFWWQQPAGGYPRSGKATELPVSLRWIMGRRVCCGVSFVFVVLTQDLEAPSLISAFLQRL